MSTSMRRRDEVMVGIVISIALLVLMGGTLWLARGGLTSGYPLYAKFPWGFGIKQGQQVLLTGVNIGFVGDVDLRQDGTLLVTMRIDKQYRVPEGTTASIEPNGIFGDVDIALRPAHPTHSFLSPSDTVPIGPSQPGLQDILARADTASAKLGDVARAIQVEMVQNGGIADLRKTMTSTNALVTQLSQIAEKQSAELSITMHTLNRSLAAIDSTTVDSTLRNMKAATANLNTLTASLKTTTAQLNDLLAKADSGQGSVAKLLNDPVLYNNLQHSIASMDSLLTDLKAHPKRYINVHVF